MAKSRARLTNDLEEHVRFESLLLDLSARFINLAPDQVDGEIENAQRRICEYLGLDLSSLWQLSAENPPILTLSHLYRPLGGPPIPEPMDATEYFPWCLQQLTAGKVTAVSSIEDVPAEAARDQEVWRHYGIKTSLGIPLSVGGGPVFGVLSFNTMRAERTWPEALVKQLQLVAQVFANALARKQAERELRESEAKLRMATSAAGAGLWILALDSGDVWVTPKTRELFHFSPDEALTYESFFKVIHPEDRERVHQSVQQACQSGEHLLSEYRIVLSDGKIRWISARGQPHLSSTGEPQRLMGVSLDITEHKLLEEQLREQYREIEELKERLEKENFYLQEEIQLLLEHTGIVGQSLAMKRVMAQVEQVARTGSTVLIQGETGTGKELVARAIHRLSSRKDRPLVTVNCGSLPPTLIESELFGRERGAYTGALTQMIGRFEIADGSTLFLDEIGELPIEMQSKLLRVLEEGNFERLGSTKTLHVDVRIIAATNRDIVRAVRAGKFRKDLFYRLNVFPIVIPPLRERIQDLPLLVWAFVKEFQKKMGKDIERIPNEAMEALKAYSWPGNVRELRNVMEHAMIVTSGTTLQVRPPTLDVAERSEDSWNLQELERRHILRALEETGWRVAGKKGAAEILGLKPTTLESRMKKLGIHRPKP